MPVAIDLNANEQVRAELQPLHIENSQVQISNQKAFVVAVPQQVRPHVGLEEGPAGRDPSLQLEHGEVCGRGGRFARLLKGLDRFDPLGAFEFRREEEDVVLLGLAVF